MAVDIDTIGIAVDTRDVKTASKELDTFGRSADKASRQADDFGKTTEKGTSLASSGMARFAGAVGIAYAAFATFSRFASSADTYTKITSQLKLATSSQEQYNKALSDVSRIANTAQANIESVSKLYSRLSMSLSELGVEQTKIAGISETVALALKVSGAEASETASVMLQLSQAFGSGVLRGDEFNSMAENSPTLMRALAASMGVTTGALRDLASEGQITREVLLKAFGDEKLLESLRKQAQSIGTVGGAIQIVKNRLIELIGTIDKSTGASTWVRDVFGNLSEYLAAMKLTIESGTWFEKLRFFTIGNLSERLTTQLRNPQAPGARGNSLPGNAAITGGMTGPNMSSPRAVEDINKIHQAQEDAARKASQAQDDYRRKQKEIYNDKLRELQDEVQEEADNADATAKYKFDKDKDLKDAIEKADKEEYKRKLEQLNLLQKQANQNFDEAQKRVKELEDEAKRSAENLNRSLTDALLRGFESGKGFAKNFRDTLVNLFKTLILQPVVKFLVDSSGISSVLAGLGTALTSGGASAGESSGGGFGGIFSSVKDFFGNGNNSIIGSIENLGSIIANGNGGLLDSIGGFIGANSSAIADGFGYFGAALQIAQGNVLGGIGAGVGTFFGGPIGGAIGSFIGSALGGLFGGGLPPRVTESRTGVLRDGKFTAYDASDPGKRKLGLASPLDNLNETFANQLNTFFKAFDINSVISSSALLTQKKVVRARFSYGVDNAGGYGYEEDFGKKGTFEQAFAALVENALGQVTVKAIQASSLPEGIKKFFDGLTKKEDVTDAINTLIGLKMALGDLPDIFDAVRNAIDTTAYTTTIAQLKAQFEATQNFVNLFYSDTEKFNIFTQQLATQLGMLNEVLPTSRDEYRLLVESINVVDAASRDQYNGLIALAPAMNEYFNLLGQQANGINEVNQALADGLNQNLFSTFADYASARVNVANGLSPAGFMANNLTPQGNADLLQAVRDLREAQANTNIVLEAIAAYTYDTAKTQKQWNNDGLPAERVM